jgi:hypothetical protein
MVILSDLFAAGWRLTGGVRGWKTKNLEKRRCSRKEGKESQSGQSRRKMSRHRGIKTAKAGHANLLGEFEVTPRAENH